MSSAPVGTRMVARALPGGAGSAARARASAACLAACRAAQGAAPRSPSLRFAGTPFASSLITASLGLVTEFSAEDRFAFETWAAFLTGLAGFFFGAGARRRVVVAFFFDMCSVPAGPRNQPSTHHPRDPCGPRGKWVRPLAAPDPKL